MYGTATAGAHRRETHRRPYVPVLIVLALVTAVEIVAFTPNDWMPDALRTATDPVNMLDKLTKRMQIVVLMGFAAIKALLVAAFYMHLKYENRWVRTIPLLAIVGVVILIGVISILA